MYRILFALFILLSVAGAQTSSNSSSSSFGYVKLLHAAKFVHDDIYPQPYWPPALILSSGGLSSSSGTSSSQSSSSFPLQMICDQFIDEQFLHKPSPGHRDGYLNASFYKSYGPGGLADWIWNIDYGEYVRIDLPISLSVKKEGECSDYFTSLRAYGSKYPYLHDMDVLKYYYPNDELPSWRRFYFIEDNYDIDSTNYTFAYERSFRGEHFYEGQDVPNSRYPENYSLRDLSKLKVMRSYYDYWFAFAFREDPVGRIDWFRGQEILNESCIEVPKECEIEICENMMDDDHDLKIDCEDPQCLHSSSCSPPPNYSEFCGDHLDNDKNGLTDCSDPACQNAGECLGRRPCLTEADCSDPNCSYTDFCRQDAVCDLSAIDCSNLACANQEACQSEIKDSVELCNGDDPDEDCPSDPCSKDNENTGGGSCPINSQVQPGDGEPVSVFDGSLYMSRNDIGLAQTNLFWIQPYYNSLWDHFSGFGHGWNSILDVRLLPALGGGWVLRGDYGQKEVFNQLGENQTKKLSPYNIDLASVHKKLRMGRDLWYEFDAEGLLIRISNASGEAVDLAYAGSGAALSRQGISGNGFPIAQFGAVALGYRLTTATNANNSADQLHITYNTAGYIESIYDNSGRSVSYTYDVAGNLIQVAKPTGTGSSIYSHYVFTQPNEHQIAKFTSDWVGCLTCIDTKDWVLNQFDALGRVESQKFSDRSFKFEYRATNMTGRGPYTKVTVARLDAAGNETEEKVTHWYANAVTGTGTNRQRIMESMEGVSEPSLDGGENRYTKGTQYVFDAQNRVKAQFDERGRWVIYNRDLQGRIIDKYTIAGLDTVLFLHKEWDAVTGLEALRLEGGYKVNRDTLKTTFEYYSGVNLGQIKSEKKWLDETQYLETQYEYNSSGSLTKRINADGSVEEYFYSGGDQKHPSSKSVNGQTIETYLDRDFAGRVTRMQNFEGQIATRSYDLLGRLLESCNYEGICTENTYEGRNLVTTVKGKTSTEIGITSYFDYDDLGRVTKEYTRNATGGRSLVRTIRYDADGNAIEKRDAVHQMGVANEVALYSLEGNRLIQSTDGGGYSRIMQYDSAGNVVAIANPAGHVTRMSYDHDGNMVTRTLPNGGVEYWAYDSRGNQVLHTDAMNRTSYTVFDRLKHEIMRIGTIQDTVKTEYDSFGRIALQRSPEGMVKLFHYNGYGQLWRMVYKTLGETPTLDADDVVEQFTYDAYGRQTMVQKGRVDSLITISQYTYDGIGRKLSETDAVNRVTYYSYFGHGGIRRILLPTGDSINYSYDHTGKRTAEYYNGVLQSTIEYDEAGRTIGRKELGGDTLVYSYNPNNQVSLVKDGEDRETKLEYDAYGKVSKTTDPAGKVTSVIRDVMGHDSLRIDPVGNVTLWNYDRLGRTTVIAVNDTQQVNYYYADAGVASFKATVSFSGAAVLEWKDRDGRLYEKSQGPDKVRYSYNNQGLLDGKFRERNLAEETKRDTVLYFYDIFGRLDSTSSSDGDGIISKKYDNMGKPLQITQRIGGADYTTNFVYDVLNNQVTETLPSGSTKIQGYDGRGRLLYQILDGDTLATYQWTGQKNSTRHLGNGITSTSGWDGSGLINSLDHQQESVVALSMQLERNQRGDISNVLRSPWQNSGESFEYRNDRQLESHIKVDTTTDWGLAGGMGLVSSITRTAVDGGVKAETRTVHPNQKEDTITYSDGSILVTLLDYNSRVFAIGEDTLVWSTDHQLLKYGDVEYEYDCSGRLIRRISGDGSWVTYIYNGNQVSEEHHSDGSSKTFVWGTYIDEPVAIRTKSQFGAVAIYYPLSGLNHNVEALTDAQGQVVERYSVQPYGAFTAWAPGADGIAGSNDDVALQASELKNNLIFQGRPFDADAGIYYWRARWYSPVLMKWLSNDPLMYEAGDANLMRFVGNDPVNRVDPMGLFFEKPDWIQSGFDLVDIKGKIGFSGEAGYFYPFYGAIGVYVRLKGDVSSGSCCKDGVQRKYTKASIIGEIGIYAGSPGLSIRPRFPVLENLKACPTEGENDGGAVSVGIMGAFMSGSCSYSSSGWSCNGGLAVVRGTEGKTFDSPLSYRITGGGSYTFSKTWLD